MLLIGLGIGGMLTPSVNVVQSSFPAGQQGEISGLSRSVSNLGSSLGAAIAGTILVAGITTTPGRAYGLAMITLAAIGASVWLRPSCYPEASRLRPQRQRRSTGPPSRSTRHNPGVSDSVTPITARLTTRARTPPRTRSRMEGAGSIKVTDVRVTTSEPAHGDHDRVGAFLSNELALTVWKKDHRDP